MICAKNADTNGKRVLLTSDLPNPEDAARETGAWLRAHGYEFLPDARPLLVYENGVCVREWRQAERQVCPDPPFALAFCPSLRIRASLAALLRFHPPRTA